MTPVRDMVEVLTSMCARFYGRRGARNRGKRVVTAIKHAPARPPAAARRHQKGMAKVNENEYLAL